MQFISESDFERALADIEDSDMEELIVEMTEQQTTLSAYVFSEGFQVLTEEERAYFLFLMASVWHTIRTATGEVPVVTEEALGEAEEANYALLEGVKAKGFRDKLNVFFDGTEQEDILAFLEDSLTLDEEEETVLTPEGQLPIFIGIKSFVDCL